MSRISLPFIFLSSIVICGCNPFINNTSQDSSARPSFRLNPNGDTILINYTEKGLVTSEVTVKNGKMNGLAYNYYDNGNVENEISYKDGQKNGRSTWNYENGKLFRETEYVMGEMEGIQKKYYENGKLMAEIPYSKGELQTGTKEYSKDGNLKNNVPEIVFEGIDKIAFDGQYTLRISLSKKQSNTKFFRLLEMDRGKPIVINLKTEGDCATITWDLKKGELKMEKVRIIAEYKTNMGNPAKIEKTYNLAIEKR